jgi:hypothetical protein
MMVGQMGYTPLSYLLGSVLSLCPETVFFCSFAKSFQANTKIVSDNRQ